MPVPPGIIDIIDFPPAQGVGAGRDLFVNPPPPQLLAGGDLQPAGNLAGQNTYYVECVQNPASPEGEFRDDGSNVVRTYWIQWSKRSQSRKDLLGWPVVKQAGGQSFISRSVPHLYPEEVDTNGNAQLYATACKQVEGWGIPAAVNGQVNMKSLLNVAQYLYAKMRVTYETLTYDVLDDADMVVNGYTVNGVPDEATLARYVTLRTHPSAEYLTLPQGSFKIVLSANNLGPFALPAVGPAVPGAPGRIVPGYDVSLTWHRIPRSCIGSRLWNPNLARPPIDMAIGCVNSVTFAGCPPGTLLCLPPDIRPIRSATLDRIADIEYRLKWFQVLGADGTPLKDINGNTVGHNHLFLTTAQGVPAAGYYEVSSDGQTNMDNKAVNKNIYNWCDLNALFRVPA